MPPGPNIAAKMNQAKAHGTVVSVAKFDDRKFDHVDFNAIGGEVFEYGLL